MLDLVLRRVIIMKIIILQVGFALIDETVEYDFAININIVVRDEIAADLLR